MMDHSTSTLNRMMAFASGNCSNSRLILNVCLIVLVAGIIAYFYFAYYRPKRQQEQQLCQGQLSATPYCQLQRAQAKAKAGAYSMITTIRHDLSIPRTDLAGAADNNVLDYEDEHYDVAAVRVVPVVSQAQAAQGAMAASRLTISAEDAQAPVAEPFRDHSSGQDVAAYGAGALMPQSGGHQLPHARNEPARPAATVNDGDCKRDEHLGALDSEFSRQAGAGGRALIDDDAFGVPLTGDPIHNAFAERLQNVDFTDKSWTPPRTYDERFDAILGKGGDMVITATA